MTVQEAISARHSVRTYLTKPPESISEEKSTPSAENT